MGNASLSPRRGHQSYFFNKQRISGLYAIDVIGAMPLSSALRHCHVIEAKDDRFSDRIPTLANTSTIPPSGEILAAKKYGSLLRPAHLQILLALRLMSKLNGTVE